MTTLLEVDLDYILTTIQPLLVANCPCNLFITGGTGFYGKWVVEPLILARRRWNLDLSVTILSRSPEGFLRSSPHLRNAAGLSFVQGDVRTFDIPAGRFSHVLHFAGSTRLADYENSPLDQYCTIVDGTSRVLKFAHNCGAKRFLLASSGAIYGLQPENLAGFPENYEGAPLTTESRGSYANCKRAAEQLCTLYHDHFGMQTVITRGFAFSGPHLALDTHHAFGSLMSDALKGHTLEVLGDGTTRRSFLYGADLCVWLLALLFQGVAGQAYNIGSAQELSIYQLASAIAAQFGLDIHVHKTYSPGSPIHRYIPDTTKATALGLRETVTLDQAISRTAQFYRRAAG